MADPFSSSSYNYLIKVTDDVMNLCCLALWVHSKITIMEMKGSYFRLELLCVCCLLIVAFYASIVYTQIGCNIIFELNLIFSKAQKSA